MTFRQQTDVFTRAQQWYEEGCAYNTIGQRDKACQALKQCLALDEQHVTARLLLTLLQQALQPTEVRRLRIPIEEADYALFAKPVVTLGRQEGNDVILLNTDVSRYHARS